jgi:chromosome partitioning protein
MSFYKYIFVKISKGLLNIIVALYNRRVACLRKRCFMKTICIFNQKGGVGKTTTNINLCANLAMEGYKVLTIDVDPQGNTTSGLGIDKNKVKKSIYDVLTYDTKVEEVIVKSELLENFFIIPSTMALAGAEVELINVNNRERVLSDKLKEFNGDFDYVFIDCPPSLGFLTINALSAADSVLIPIQCEFYALEGVGQLVNTYQLVKKSLNKELQIEGVIMSMYDSRNNLSMDVVEEVRKYFKDKVYNTMIPRNIRLAEAPSFGLPISLYDGNCKGAEAYQNITKEFLSRQKEGK